MSGPGPAGERRLSGRQLGRLVRPGAAPEPPGPYYAALADTVRGLILDGRLPVRTRLPAERDLARALDVSRTTVTAAYNRLRETGFVESRHGSGSWTALPVPGGGSGGITLTPDAEHVDLGVAAPGAVSRVAPAAVAAAHRLAEHTSGQGYTTTGLPELRAAVAGHYTARGLPTAPEQIFITNGAQQGVALLLRCLLGPGDGLLIESPSYPHPMAAARDLGARLVPVGVTAEGWDLGLTTSALRQSGARAGYLIPDFHNPTGAVMPAAARAELVAAARAAGAALIADESTAELAIDPVEMPPPLAAFDPDGRVHSVGSLSKLVWGGLRVGWVRTTPPMVERLAALRSRVDLAGPLLEQLLALELMPALAEIRAERAAGLRAGRDALLAALAAELPHWRCPSPPGGLVVWAELPEPVAGRLAEAAARQGVRVVPGPVFGMEGTLERYLRISYARPTEVLAGAVARLAAADAQVRASAPGRPALPYV
ncbi:PLP-dependent aminotransferase family protein [Allonocardiopsis opalescens]|uniref:GntR family transcriptional regulator n=1 Tax=Allonocardiopsis opalescens TaxID=1144618 RepID=A0A2T0Q4A6_9ACTN|nr:PLP-dependent aminotransferase family protein [Allonocardiopsis opalescens]PRX98610.1 GntR family transcriptional regulator [Allonocardiopsis opalescens]